MDRNDWLTYENEWELRIAKLELAYGDILVVKTPTGRTSRALESLRPAGVRILYIPADVELSVLTKADIEARVADGKAA